MLRRLTCCQRCGLVRKSSMPRSSAECSDPASAPSNVKPLRSDCSRGRARGGKESTPARERWPAAFAAPLFADALDAAAAPRESLVVSLPAPTTRSAPPSPKQKGASRARSPLRPATCPGRAPCRPARPCAAPRAARRSAWPASAAGATRAAHNAHACDAIAVRCPPTALPEGTGHTCKPASRHAACLPTSPYAASPSHSPAAPCPWQPPPNHTCVRPHGSKLEGTSTMSAAA